MRRCAIVFLMFTFGAHASADTLPPPGMTDLALRSQIYHDVPQGADSVHTFRIEVVGGGAVEWTHTGELTEGLTHVWYPGDPGYDDAAAALGNDALNEVRFHYNDAVFSVPNENWWSTRTSTQGWDWTDEWPVDAMAVHVATRSVIPSAGQNMAHVRFEAFTVPEPGALGMLLGGLLLVPGRAARSGGVILERG